MPIHGLTMEISEFGFSAMVTQALEVGETITASFNVPSAGHITVDAVVRNENLLRYGFELLFPSVQVRQEMKQACESLPIYEGGWQ
jgi:hypothetical protein